MASSSRTPQTAVAIALATMPPSNTVIVDFTPDSKETIPKHDGGLIIDNSAEVSQTEGMMVAATAIVVMMILAILMTAAGIWLIVWASSAGEEQPNQQSMTSYLSNNSSYVIDHIE